MIPTCPGVYIFKDKKDNVLYVGKALDLKRRISSYFQKPKSPKITKLVKDLAKIETIPVSSEVEALILEANLIKKYQPHYNIKLTDSKDYLYVKITLGVPKVLTARKKDLCDSKKFFGPFPSARVVRDTLKKLRRLFPWCSAPQGVSLKDRPCFHYHLGLCPGICCRKISLAEYKKTIRHFIKFMEGRKDELVKDLTKEMERYAENLQYEKAAEIKKTIDGVEYLTSSTAVQSYLENPNFLQEENKLALMELKKVLALPKLAQRIEGYDISNIQGKDATGSMVVLNWGGVDKSQFRKFRIRMSGKPNDVAMMQEIVRRRLKHKEWPLPDLIIVDGGRGQARGVKYEVLGTEYEIPVFGLAKKMEWLYPPEGKILKLPKNSLSLKLLQKIRDESHRFALSYHRKLRVKMFL